MKKLAGHYAGTASWVTNVGNEHGQVLMSVATTGEGLHLERMASGIVRRYKDAHVDPPKALYVDRNCCGPDAPSRVFLQAWPSLAVRLDSWHFMRRIAGGVITEAHVLYAPFMAGLSQSIFQWDRHDMLQLKTAKRYVSLYGIVCECHNLGESLLSCLPPRWPCG